MYREGAVTQARVQRRQCVQGSSNSGGGYRGGTAYRAGGSNSGWGYRGGSVYREAVTQAGVPRYCQHQVLGATHHQQYKRHSHLTHVSHTTLLARRKRITAP